MRTQQHQQQVCINTVHAHTSLILQAIFVFIAPPSLEDLAKRLNARGTEDLESINQRLANAKAEINRLETGSWIL